MQFQQYLVVRQQNPVVFLNEVMWSFLLIGEVSQSQQKVAFWCVRGHLNTLLS